jgi:hypothetical protein
MAGAIFTSYRRSDSAGYAGRIADYFAYHYPDVRVFFDTVSIEPGEDFRAAVVSRLQSSEVVLAIIGEAWVGSVDGAGRRRLDDPNDIVRLELSMALSFRARVIPVLLDGAPMPSASELPDDLKSLANRNAEHVRGVTFLRDMEHIGKFVHKYVEGSTKIITAPPVEQGLEPTSGVKKELMRAFERFRDDAPDDAFMICENPSGQYVQFLKTEEGKIIFDLPSIPLNAKQLITAQRFLTENYQAECADLGDEHIVYNVTWPLEPSFLSYVTLETFAKIYGYIPKEPLNIIIDS